MSPTPLTPPAQGGYSACLGSEDATPRSKKSLPSHAYHCGSVDRTLGRRSLDAFNSLRGSFQGRRALQSTTNQKPVAPAMSASAGSNPVGPPAKQRWYESLRDKSSQIPTPSSPTSMSSTLKRSRFFRSSPTQLPIDSSPSVALQTQAIGDPHPKLEVASFRSELQRMSIFGEHTERSYADTEPMAYIRNRTFNKSVRVHTQILGEAESGSQAQLAPAAPATEMKLLLPGSAETGAETKSAEKQTLTVAIASVVACKKPLELSRVPCDLYYKGTPWQPGYKKDFPDTTSALSHFALRHILSDCRDCSSTLLWTSDIRMPQLQVNQTFTVYPPIDGPLRAAIRKKYDLRRAIITFANDSSSTKSIELCDEDERLMIAIRNIISMGYHVDVWTDLDNAEWDVDLALAEVELGRDLKEEAHVRNASRSASVFLDPQHLERRERYEVFVGHGVTGFVQADLELLDSLRREVLRSERLDWKSIHDDVALVDAGHPTSVEPAQVTQIRVQNSARSELVGFLEHTEETIAKLDWE